jgi:hypothetical protein
LDTATIPQTLAQESRSFSLAVFESAEYEKLAERALDATSAWNQRACKLAAPLVFWFAIKLMIFREDSIKVILERLLRMLRERHPNITPQDVTPEAVCKARYRLGYEPLQVAFEESTQRIDPPPTFCGLRTYAIDGTKMNMPDTPANEAKFGRQKVSRGRSAFPQMAVVTLVDTYGHGIRGIEYGPWNAPERPSGLSLLRRLGPGELGILDRGYPARRFFYEAKMLKANFVARVSSNWILTPVEVLSDRSSLIDLPVGVPLPIEERTPKRKTHIVLVRLRLVEYQVDEGDPIRLLTDLLDPEIYPAREIACIYHERWEAEVNNAETKVTLATVKHGKQATTFRSKQPDGVLQELYALFLGYNLIREMMTDAAEAHGVPPRHLSLTSSIQIIREAIPRFDKAKGDELAQRYTQLLSDLAHALIDRPRRPRSNPRVVKRKMSSFKVKRLGMCGEIRSFEVKILQGSG